MDFHMQRRQGLSIRKIAAINGVSRNAVRRALRSLTPPDGKRQRSQGDKLAPFHEQLATWLRDPVKTHWTGARILDELEDRGYQGGRTVLMDYLRRVRPKPAAQAEARFYVKPGQQIQIDWAEMGPVPVGGVMTKVYVFVAILAWSRTLFVRFTTDMQLLTWLDCHRRAFEFLGGVPSEVLIDNLKTGVDSRAGGTVRWNAKYQELAVALGFNPMAQFPMRPKTKGRVERIVTYVRGRFFIGRDVVNLDRLNDDAMDWLEQRANRRVHRVTAQRPCDRLTTERASLMPLVAYDIKLEENRVAVAYALVSCDGVRYSVRLKAHEDVNTELDHEQNGCPHGQVRLCIESFEQMDDVGESVGRIRQESDEQADAEPPEPAPRSFVLEQQHAQHQRNERKQQIPTEVKIRAEDLPERY
jgi:transposase